MDGYTVFDYIFLFQRAKILHKILYFISSRSLVSIQIFINKDENHGTRIIEQFVYLYRSSIIYKFIFHKPVNKFNNKGIRGYFLFIFVENSQTKRRLFKFFPPIFSPSIPSVISENINVLANNQKLEKCKLLSRICLFIR